MANKSKEIFSLLCSIVFSPFDRPFDTSFFSISFTFRSFLSAYFLPVDMKTVIDIIVKERPDSIILSMGGQTALNVGVELHESVSCCCCCFVLNIYCV